MKKQWQNASVFIIEVEKVSLISSSGTGDDKDPTIDLPPLPID